MSKDDGIAFGKPFRPGLQIRYQGGLPSNSTIVNYFNELVGNKAWVWLDKSEGTQWYAYLPSVRWRQFYVDKGTTEPANPTDPNDPQYDWSVTDSYRNNSLVTDPNIQLKINIALDTEGKTFPKWMDGAGLIGTQGDTTNPREQIDWTKPRAAQAYIDFLTAFAARYNGDDWLGYFRFEEDNPVNNTTLNQWGAAREPIFRHAVSVLTEHHVFLAASNYMYPRLEDLTFGHYLDDMKPFFGSCGSGGGPFDGTNPDCNFGDFYGKAQYHAGIVENVQGAGGIARPVVLDKAQNGFRVQGSNNAPWSPLGALPNSTYNWPPEGDPYDMDAHVFLWYGSVEQRNSNVSDLWGTNNIINWGVIPNFIPSIGNIAGQTFLPDDDNWRLALDRFGANGRKMIPALPYDWFDTDPDPDPDPPPTSIYQVQLNTTQMFTETFAPTVNATLPVDITKTTNLTGSELTLELNRFSVSTTTADITPPGVPDLTLTSVTDTTVTVNWDTQVDSESGLFGYNLYLDDVLQVTAGGNQYTFSGLTQGTEYRIQITSVDNAGNESAKSGPLTVTTTTPVGTATVPELSATAISANKINIRWTQGEYEYYRLYRDNVLIATTKNLVYTDTGLTNSTQYKYQVDSTDRLQTTSTDKSDPYYVTTDPRGGPVTWTELDDS